MATEWAQVNRAPPLADGTAHVWRLSVALDASGLPAARDVLSPAELERADRFKHDAARGQFIASRAGLRAVLAGYLGIEPRQVQFVFGEHGKPSLADASSRISFNLSRSNRWALIAVTLEHRVGVDIEMIRPVTDLDNLARTVFSAREHTAFLAIALEDRLRAFFNGWTRKEAFVKAIGTGLAMPLHSFDVSLGERSELLRAASEDVSRWSMLSLDPADGYIGALAIDTPEVVALRLDVASAV